MTERLKKSLSLYMITVENDNKVLSRKQICKLKRDNGWPEDTAWFPFICLFVTVYFQPLTFWCLKKLFDWFRNLKKNKMFFWKRESKIATFPTFSAVRSVRTFGSYLLWQNQYTESICERNPQKMGNLYTHFYAFEAVVNK